MDAEHARAAALRHAEQLVSGRGGAAQLCVRAGDAVVLDTAVGCGAGSLFWLFSACKPFIAVLVLQLVEEGALELDQPIARCWPQFGARGKDAITVRHVLAHRAGLPYGGRSPLGDLALMGSWDRSVRRIERTRPRVAPGTAPAYQFLTHGVILGELVQRVTGEPLRERFAARITEPLGLRDTHLGLPDTLLERAVTVHGRGILGRAAARLVNRPRTRTAMIPAAGVSSTARELAMFYAALLHPDRAGVPRLLSPASIAELRRPTSDHEVDRFARIHIRWAQGVQLGGPRVNPAKVPPFGRTSDPLAFGHNGSNTCIAWAAPDRDLVVAHLTDRLGPRGRCIRHLAAVADAILEGWPLPARSAARRPGASGHPARGTGAHTAAGQ